MYKANDLVHFRFLDSSSASSNNEVLLLWPTLLWVLSSFLGHDPCRGSLAGFSLYLWRQSSFFEDRDVFRLDTYRHRLHGGGLFFAETIVAVGSVLDGIVVVVVVLDLLLLPTPMQQQQLMKKVNHEEIVEV